MPQDIVKMHRLVYRNIFMQRTLHPIAGAEMKFPAFYQDQGFPDHYIIVTFDGPRHPQIWATNIVQQQPDGSYLGIIEVNPDLLRESKEKVKFVMAEEWLVVMLSFRDPEKRKLKRMKVELTELFYKIRQTIPWADSRDEGISLLSAIRYLLVSEQSLHEMAQEIYGFDSMAQVSNLVQSNPTEAQNIIETIAGIFSTKWSVDKELVLDRIQETLFEAS